MCRSNRRKKTQMRNLITVIALRRHMAYRLGVPVEAVTINWPTDDHMPRMHGVYSLTVAALRKAWQTLAERSKCAPPQMQCVPVGLIGFETQSLTTAKAEA
jgi:hypothetical protein